MHPYRSDSGLYTAQELPRRFCLALSYSSPAECQPYWVLISFCWFKTQTGITKQTSRKEGVSQTVNFDQRLSDEGGNLGESGCEMHCGKTSSWRTKTRIVMKKMRSSLKSLWNSLRGKKWYGYVHQWLGIQSKCKGPENFCYIS